MTSLPKDKLERLVERWHTIQAELNAGASQASYVKLTREFSELDPVVAAINNLTALEREKCDLEAMAADASADKDMAQMARERVSLVNTMSVSHLDSD